jgi:hypothetical protein
MHADDPSAGLPPRPDPQTGKPIPPAAPTQHPEGYKEKNPRFPAPPPGMGPTLAVYCQKLLVSWASGFIPVVVLTVAGILYGGFEVLTLWTVWTILAIVYAWTVFIMRINTVSAGADWVRGGRKHWVKIYELTQIHLRNHGSNQPGLFLADQERTVEIPLGVLQYERNVWNFVHLGMQHSAANGAELDANARATFPEIAEAACN